MKDSASMSCPPGVPMEVQDAVRGWILRDREDVASSDGDTAESEILEEISLAAEKEYSVLLALAQEQRTTVVERLLALWRYRQSPKSMNVSVLATALGTGRANVYRLMQRMSDIGPIRGLVPQYRSESRTSHTHDGFGKPFDAWIEDALRSEPEISIAGVARHLDEMLRQHPDREVAPPSSSALKRRVQQLRKTSVKRAGRIPIGAKLLVDTCRIDISVLTPSIDTWWVTVIVDAGSGLVCGLGLDPEAGFEGLIGALSDMRRRLPDIAHQIAVAHRLEGVEWVVPPSLAERAEEVGSGVPASRRPWIDLQIGSKRQPGVRLLRLIGDEMGGHRLLTRRQPSRPELHATRVFSMSQAALYVLEKATTERNGGILREMPKLGTRGRAASIENAQVLCADLTTLFDTVKPYDA